MLWKMARLRPAPMTCAGPLTEQERSCREYRWEAASDAIPTCDHSPRRYRARAQRELSEALWSGRQPPTRSCASASKLAGRALEPVFQARLAPEPMREKCQVPTPATPKQATAHWRALLRPIRPQRAAARSNTPKPRADARGCDGSVRQELATAIARPAIGEPAGPTPRRG